MELIDVPEIHLSLAAIPAKMHLLEITCSAKVQGWEVKRVFEHDEWDEQFLYEKAIPKIINEVRRLASINHKQETETF